MIKYKLVLFLTYSFCGTAKHDTLVVRYYYGCCNVSRFLAEGDSARFVDGVENYRQDNFRVKSARIDTVLNQDEMKVHP